MIGDSTMQKKSPLIFLLLLLNSTSITMASNDHVFFDLGIFALHEGQTNTARQYFGKAFLEMPDNPNYLYYLGKTELAEKNYELAQKQFDIVWQRSPNIPGLAFDLATTHFYQKKYTSAVKFYELAINQVVDAEQLILAYFQTGMAQFHLRNYERAIPYLLHAAKNSPSFKFTAYYYAGICFYQQHEWTLAYNYFKHVKMHAPRRYLRRQALKWLIPLKKKQAQYSPYNLYCKFSIVYDDNVTFESTESDMESDDRLNSLLLFARYHLVNESDCRIGMGYGHYQSSHMDNSESNLINSHLYFYGIFHNDIFQWNTELVPSYFWLDRHRFLYQTQWRSRLRFWIEKSVVPSLHCSYTMDNHFHDEHRDSNRHGIGLGLSFMFDPDFYHLETLFTSEKISSSHQNHNYETLKAELNLNVFAYPSCTFTFCARSAFRNHEHLNSFYQIKREEHQYQARLGIEIPLQYKGLFLEMKYQWSKTDSNIHVYTFQKNLFAFQLFFQH